MQLHHSVKTRFFAIFYCRLTFSFPVFGCFRQLITIITRAQMFKTINRGYYLRRQEIQIVNLHLWMLKHKEFSVFRQWAKRKKWEILISPAAQVMFCLIFFKSLCYRWKVWLLKKLHLFIFIKDQNTATFLTCENNKF